MKFFNNAFDQEETNASTNEVYGVECLLRWNHSEQGLIPPNLFIPLAELNGSIKYLSYFVLKTAIDYFGTGYSSLQRFLYALPLIADDFETWLKTFNSIYMKLINVNLLCYR